MTLTEFLLARIAEDEAGFDQPVWRNGHQYLPEGHIFHITQRIDIAPRLRAECEAKRLTVRFLGDLERGEFGDTMTSSIAYSTLCRVAAVYVDHPDYRQEWRP